MQVLPASHWQTYLTRIGQRYAGQPVVLRQHQPSLAQTNVVLWQMPLRGLFADGSRVGAEITVQTGHSVPYTDIVLEAVQEIQAQFDGDAGLKALHILTDEDGVAILLFDKEQ